MKNLQRSSDCAMTAWRAGVIALAVLVGSTGEAAAVGEAGAQFLKIPVGPKACAMGEAFVAVADDPSALYWNPAGIAVSKSPQIMLMHMTWLENMSYQHLAASTRTRFGVLGLALSYSSSGSIPGYDEEFRATGDFSAYDAYGTIAYGCKVPRLGALGLSAKVIQQRIEDENALGCALDAGVLVERLGFEGLRAAVSVQNIGPGIKFIEQADPLPLTGRVGLAYVARHVSLAADLCKPRFNDWSFHGGAEVRPLSVFALRAGYLTRPDQDAAYRLGMGLIVKRVAFEYAFIPNDDLNSSHCFACVLSW